MIRETILQFAIRAALTGCRWGLGPTLCLSTKYLSIVICNTPRVDFVQENVRAKQISKRVNEISAE